MKAVSPLALLPLLLAVSCRSPICPHCGKDIRKKPVVPVESRYLPAQRVSGTLACLDRRPPHPLAVATVRLVDYSVSPSSPSYIVASVTVSPLSVFPAAFSMDLPADTLERRHVYGLSADISVEGDVLFRTDTKYQVLTYGRGSSADLVLIRVSQQKDTP